MRLARVDYGRQKVADPYITTSTSVFEFCHFGSFSGEVETAARRILLAPIMTSASVGYAVGSEDRTTADGRDRGGPLSPAGTGSLRI
jgi:hypothetical protein